MKELLFVGIFYALFLVVSLKLKKSLLGLKLIWSLLLLPYLIAIWWYLELILRFHYFLRDHQIYLELGHASILLIELLVLMYITALIIIVDLLYRKLRNMNVN
jgi:hypothetical protein